MKPRDYSASARKGWITRRKNIARKIHQQTLKQGQKARARVRERERRATTPTSPKRKGKGDKAAQRRRAKERKAEARRLARGEVLRVGEWDGAGTADLDTGHAPVNLNVRLLGPPGSTPDDVRRALEYSIEHLRPPEGWKIAVIDWRNPDSKADPDWRTSADVGDALATLADVMRAGIRLGRVRRGYGDGDSTDDGGDDGE